MSPRRAAIAVALVIGLAPCTAGADDARPLPRPVTQLDSGDGTLVLPSGLQYRVPRGSRIQQPEAVAKLDAEMRRLQELEVRLAAENKSLRASAKDWRPGWVVVTSAIVVGLATGVYVGTRF